MHSTSWILCALQEEASKVFIYSQIYLCYILVHWLAPFQIFAVISPSCHTVQILAVKRISSHVLINMGGGSSLTLEWFVLYPRLFSGLQYNKPNKWKVKQKLLQFSHRPFPNVSQGKGLTFPVPHPLPVLSAYNLTFFINLKIRSASSSALHPFSSEYRLSYFLSENVQNFTICTVIWILFLIIPLCPKLGQWKSYCLISAMPLQLFPGHRGSLYRVMRQDSDQWYLLKDSCAYISGKKQSVYSPATQEVWFSFSFQCPHGLKQEHCVIMK